MNPFESPVSYSKSVTSRLEDYEALSDSELLVLIDEKNKEAFEVLYDRYSNAVYSLSIRMLKESGLAEEVTQDTFVSIWRYANKYDAGRGKFVSWVFRIAHNRAIDEIRKWKRRHNVEYSHETDSNVESTDELNDPEKFAISQFRQSDIKDALSRLRFEQQRVIMLAYYCGLTQSEIAKRLNQPLGTVKTRMRLALRKLRESMDPQKEEWIQQ